MLEMQNTTVDEIHRGLLLLFSTSSKLLCCSRVRLSSFQVAYPLSFWYL
jgi:hypothetical protein